MEKKQNCLENNFDQVLWLAVYWNGVNEKSCDVGQDVRDWHLPFSS